MDKPTLASVLIENLENPSLTDDDRAFLKRWQAETKDPVWEKFAFDARKYDLEVRRWVERCPYTCIIHSAVIYRQYAAGRKGSPAAHKKKVQHDWQLTRKIFSL